METYILLAIGYIATVMINGGWLFRTEILEKTLKGIDKVTPNHKRMIGAIQIMIVAVPVFNTLSTLVFIGFLIAAFVKGKRGVYCLAIALIVSGCMAENIRPDRRFEYPVQGVEIPDTLFLVK